MPIKVTGAEKKGFALKELNPVGNNYVLRLCFRERKG